ncbi:lipopolysaccharide biosynthesis protein [Acetobacterium wieringae]|uniref:lipopolysaccharide biosynthesis protein n=1 Tax=Acetobacterium wieringae TaxID=52694 RepID=UPI002033679F|nr:hypothetical protein [Acetobacterium wieringae]URN84114.1 hypothetical protein CHL1_003289 [Acetobacterium wieringae]
MIASGRTKKSLENIVFGMGNRVVLMFFPFVIKSLLISKLGAGYLGLNNLFMSILQVLNLSELGIGTAMVYSMYKPMAENDKKTLQALLKLYRKFYYIIGAIIFGIGLVVMPFIKQLINGAYPEDINLYLLYLIYLINTVLSYFLFAYKKSLLEASQQNSIESKINTIVSIIMYVCQILALLITSNYYIFIIFMPLSTLVINLLRNHTVNKMYPDIICKGNVDKEHIHAIYKNVRALIGHRIGTTIITSADNIVISAFLGLNILAIYGNYYFILSSLISLVAIFYMSTTASIGNSLIKADEQKNFKDFKTFNFLNNWLVGWFAICLVCLYQPFMKIWMGENLMLPFHMVILFAIYFYAWLSRRIGLTYKDAAGLWQEDFWKPYIGSVVNLVINIVLVKTIGIEGVVISTIIVMVVIYFPWETKVLFTNMFQGGLKEYCLKYYSYALVTIITACLTYYVSSLNPFDGIVGLIITSVICCIVPNMVFLIVYFKTPEFKDFIERLKNYCKEAVIL